ncbi:hypothetical protein Tco_0759982 [Tanacetum coccineum]
MSVPVTAEEKTNKKNDVKARSLLLMAFPNEPQLTFSQYNDAKTMLQKIVSRLVILGVVITQEDLNSKKFRSLPPEWNTHVVVWMNKVDIEIMSIDDLYNNFKIVKQDVKKSNGASTGAQNMSFMIASSTSSTESAEHQGTRRSVRCQDNTRTHEKQWKTHLKEMLAKDVVGTDKPEGIRRKTKPKTDTKTDSGMEKDCERQSQIEAEEVNKCQKSATEKSLVKVKSTPGAKSQEYKLRG